MFMPECLYQHLCYHFLKSCHHHTSLLLILQSVKTNYQAAYIMIQANMFRLSFFLILSFLLTGGSRALFAQNPLISGQYTADPSARVFGDKVYLYPSHDIPVRPGKGRPGWFCMEDYHVFSSANLTDWTDHGVIVSQNKVPWVKPDTYSMWAPDCIARNGKYYFYFPAPPADTTLGRGFAIGVAVSDNPGGLFVPEPSPIKNVKGIDPNVFIDKDGQAYLYWSQGHIYGAKLKENMLELASEPVILQKLPEKGLKEGPYLFERNGIYYMTYPHVENKIERLEYATGDNPLGPFKTAGVIMDESPDGCWTNHHSVINFQGQWYLFYHHNDYSPSFDKNRSVRLDSLFFNADGTIRKVVPSLRGVGLTSATQKIQVDRYSKIGEKGVSVSFIDTADRFRGWKTQFTLPGSWLQYNRVDFAKQAHRTVTLLASSATSGILQIRTNSLSGPVIAEVKIPKSSSWKIVKANLTRSVTGIQNLVLVMRGPGNITLDWLSFGENPEAGAAFYSGNYPNLFRKAGYTQEDIDRKLNKAYHDIFEGPGRIYYTVGDSMAYVSDLKNHDARTEGLSYGMMVAVQLDKKDVFDRIWRWSKKYLQHQEGPRKGYFAWSINPETMKRNAEGSASDGELYYVTSLLFAANRWGNNTGIDYYREARTILDAMWEKDGTGRIFNLFNTTSKQITFVPEGDGYNWTDPSYHLPAFLEVWALYARDGHEQFYRDCADTARAFLHRTCHPETGLNPDYADFSGAPHNTRWMPAAFRFDSWRVPMNIAMDYVWFGKDRVWQESYAQRFQNFLRSKGIDTFEDQFNMDGSLPDFILPAGNVKKLRHSLGLVSTAASVSLANRDDRNYDFVDALWKAKLEPYDDGYFDPYYDGLLYLFSLMHLSGKYQIIKPLR